MRSRAAPRICSLIIAAVLLLAQNPAGEILSQINQFRGNNGLAGFQYSAALATAAQNHANWMAANNVFSSHVGAGGSTPLSRATAAGFVGAVSENIVGGTNMTPSGGLSWWVNSPTHYNTLVTTRYSMAGTGFATNGEANFYVLLVGRPSSSPPPAGSSDPNPEPIFVQPIQLATPAADGSIVHLVQEGQALWTLAAYYEVPLADLLLFNSLTEDAFVNPGDEITIRLADGAAPPPTPTPPLTHLVQEGQSLWNIATRYQVPLAELLLLNGLTETAVLQPGDEIKVRLAAGEQMPPTPTPVLYYRVQAGDSLWGIALSFGLTLEELLALNQLTEETILPVGAELLVRPLPATVPPAAASPTVTATQPPLPSTTAVPDTLAALPAATATAQSVPAAGPQPETRLFPLGSGPAFVVVAGLMGLLLAAAAIWLRQDDQ